MFPTVPIAKVTRVPPGNVREGVGATGVVFVSEKVAAVADPGQPGYDPQDMTDAVTE
jgi:hypothetical protein